MILPLSACAASAAAPTNPAAPASAAVLAGPVSYEVRSWGRLLVRWQVNPDGSGEIWRGARQQKDAGAISKYRLRLEGDALRTFTRNVEDARLATREGIACKKEIFDLPYGSITWDFPGARQTYAFDAGCRSEAGDAAQELLTLANDNVENLAKIEATPYMVDPAGPR
ncbi:hypothetical protein [Novosphingobium sp. JCM 18896]|uniref:hypothetical protein n=1 Tax=Novosphingobium sp. JCM 18896 TaxID=2989731 RepID=UPI0022220552|nr:hypothetical protein [Novosphingobium sp. JCM 18896]MCW1428435.1 hypothetical protein [Novosphingobium sp. JCM 18896]